MKVSVCERSKEAKGNSIKVVGLGDSVVEVVVIGYVFLNWMMMLRDSVVSTSLEYGRTSPREHEGTANNSARQLVAAVLRTPKSGHVDHMDHMDHMISCDLVRNTPT